MEPTFKQLVEIGKQEVARRQKSCKHMYDDEVDDTHLKCSKCDHVKKVLLHHKKFEDKLYAK